MPVQKQKKQKIPWNAHRKARQAENYGKQEKRKEARRKAQDDRAKENRIRVTNGAPTPWQQARITRHMERHHADRPA